jgi:uncharacterized secreted protein with C-terminal beta-propeller domain
MALAETIFVDKTEVVSIATTYSPYRYSNVQVRTADVVEKDGVEIARSFHRKVLHAGTVGIGTTLVPTDISGEEPEVQAICNAVWTDNAKEAYRACLVGIRSEGLG